MTKDSKRRISYIFDPEIGDQYYGEGHPMKPHRVRLTHELVMSYGLYRYMNVYKPRPLPFSELTKFHTKEYIKFLKDVTVDTKKNYEVECEKFLGKAEDSDCPIFEGLFRFSQLAAGGSVGAAEHLINGHADIAINWSGGLHHAKKVQAYGFCYVNDIVLAILKLLKCFERVLYVDIDVHHGDGVEEAFYTTNRVMTVSFHKGGNFFPGTGKLDDIGARDGKNYAVNFPLHEGINDETFVSIFRPTFDKVVECYRPGAIVLQCGADSLTRDRLGSFNLTLKGHGDCVKHVIGNGLPTLVLGGGGYTVKNVARCWAYETSIITGINISDEIPYNANYEKFSPDYRLHIKPSKTENYNTQAYLDSTKKTVFDRLKEIEIAPSVGINDRSPLENENENENKDDKDEEMSTMEVKRIRLNALEEGEDGKST